LAHGEFYTEPSLQMIKYDLQKPYFNKGIVREQTLKYEKKYFVEYKNKLKNDENGRAIINHYCDRTES